MATAIHTSKNETKLYEEKTEMKNKTKRKRSGRDRRYLVGNITQIYGKFEYLIGKG